MVALVDLDPRTVEPRLELNEDLHQVPLLNEEHTTCVGTTIVTTETKLVHQALKKNVYLIVWTTFDMPAMSPDIITHRLTIYMEAQPVVEKKCKLREEKRLVAKEETEKLLSVGFIWEARYTTWLANVVMVTKASNKWRMCVDYTNLNKACPKDSYPLPNID